MALNLKYAATALVGMALAGGMAWWAQTRPVAPKGVAASAPAPAGASAQKGGGEVRAVGVEVAPVMARPLRDDAQAVGTLRARQSVVLRPEVVGRIAALPFKDGGPVRQGQVMVQFDDQLQRAEVQQAQAQLAVAQAGYQRTLELVSSGFMSQQTLDASAASLQVAQAQLTLAQARLSRMAVRAPFSGVAGIRLVQVGDYVKDGVDLVTLEDPRQMWLDYRLPERYGTRVQPGQSVEVALDALPGRTFRANVQAVEPQLDSNGRSLAVRAALKPGESMPGWRSGMFARVTTVFEVKAQALTVPEEALVPQGGRQTVIKLVPAPVGDKLPPEVKWVSQRQDIALGVRRAGWVEVTRGLTAQDVVVVAGHQRLQKEGTPVRVVASGKEGGKDQGKAQGSAGGKAARSEPGKDSGIASGQASGAAATSSAPAR